MKKIILISSVALLLGFSSIIEAEPRAVNTTPDTSINECEEDLRCVIKNKEGKKLAACWFCDCAKIAKELL